MIRSAFRGMLMGFVLLAVGTALLAIARDKTDNLWGLAIFGLACAVTYEVIGAPKRGRS